MKVLAIILIKFFFISALFIISNGNLYLNDSEDRAIFFDSYAGWIKGVFGQGREIMGYVIDSRWLPEHEMDKE